MSLVTAIWLQGVITDKGGLGGDSKFLGVGWLLAALRRLRPYVTKCDEDDSALCQLPLVTSLSGLRSNERSEVGF